MPSRLEKRGKCFGTLDFKLMCTQKLLKKIVVRDINCEGWEARGVMEEGKGKEEAFLLNGYGRVMH